MAWGLALQILPNAFLPRTQSEVRFWPFLPVTTGSFGSISVGCAKLKRPIAAFHERRG